MQLFCYQRSESKAGEYWIAEPFIIIILLGRINWKDAHSRSRATFALDSKKVRYKQRNTVTFIGFYWFSVISSKALATSENTSAYSGFHDSLPSKHFVTRHVGKHVVVTTDRPEFNISIHSAGYARFATTGNWIVGWWWMMLDVVEPKLMSRP